MKSFVFAAIALSSSAFAADPSYTCDIHYTKITNYNTTTAQDLKGTIVTPSGKWPEVQGKAVISPSRTAKFTLQKGKESYTFGVNVMATPADEDQYVVAYSSFEVPTLSDKFQLNFAEYEGSEGTLYEVYCERVK